MDSMTDRISFVENEAGEWCYLDRDLGGWRLGYDTAWKRDIDLGETIVIDSLHFGTHRVTVEDAEKGYVLRPTDGKVAGKKFSA